MREDSPKFYPAKVLRYTVVSKYLMIKTVIFITIKFIVSILSYYLDYLTALITGKLAYSVPAICSSRQVELSSTLYKSNMHSLGEGGKMSSCIHWMSLAATALYDY